MSDALTIDFALTGVSAVAGGFSRVAAVSGRADARVRALSKSVQAAMSDLKAMNAELLRYNRLSGGSSSGIAARPAGPSAGASSVAAASGRTASGRRFVSGPFQKEAALRQNIADAHAANDGRAEADARLAYGANQKKMNSALNPPKPKGLGERALDVVKTSRFTEDGKLMPLVGKALGLVTEVLEPELAAVAGPVGLLVGAAGAAAKGLYEVATSAASSGAAFNDRANALGSSGPVGAQIGGLAGVDGVGQAKAYNAAITGGGYGTMAGYREGQHNIAGPYGKVDIGTQYWEGMEARRRMPRDEQIRQARMTGTEGSMGLMSLSEQQWQITKKQGEAQGSILGGAAGPSVDYQQSEAGLKAATDNLTAALGAPLLKPLTDFENGLAGAVNGLAGISKLVSGKGGSFVSGAMTALESTLPAPLQALLGGSKAISAAGAAQGAPGPDPNAIDGKSSTDRNTDAQNRNTAAIRSMEKSMPGTFGAQDSSGRRAAAIPSAMEGAHNPLAWKELMTMGKLLGGFS